MKTKSLHGAIDILFALCMLITIMVAVANLVSVFVK